MQPRAFAVKMIGPFRSVFEPATAAQLDTARRILALTMGVYLALGPYARIAGQPAALFRPVAPVRLLGIEAMPSIGWMVGLQLVGLAGMALAVAGRTARSVRLGFAVGWLAFFFLSALESSLGKYLHNDVLLLLVTAPLLFAPSARTGEPDEPRHRFGWPLSSGLTILVAAYFVTGLSKLGHTGPDWVFSDNIRYVMADAATSGHPWWPQIALFVSTQPFLSYLTAAYILGLELTMPAVLFVRRLRPWFAVAIVYLHVATFFTLGLDYWSWAIAATVLLLRPDFSSWARPRN